MLIAVLAAQLASQAHAEKLVLIYTDKDGIETSVDKESIHRGSDGFVYFSQFSDDDGDAAAAADCQGRTLYMLKDENGDRPDWRSHPVAVKSGSIGDAELQYVCANAG